MAGARSKKAPARARSMPPCCRPSDPRADVGAALSAAIAWPGEAGSSDRSARGSAGLGARRAAATSDDHDDARVGIAARRAGQPLDATPARRVDRQRVLRRRLPARLASESKVFARSVRVLLRSDGQSPSNRPLSRRVPGVLVQRKWLGGIGNGFTSAPAASIDASADGRFTRLVLLVELRTDADFHVVATLEECHGSPSFADEFKARDKTWLEGIWNGRYLKPGAQFMSSTAIPPPAHTRLHHFIRNEEELVTRRNVESFARFLVNKGAFFLPSIQRASAHQINAPAPSSAMANG